MKYIITIRRRNPHTGEDKRVDENPYNKNGYTLQEATKGAKKLNRFAPVLDARVEPKPEN